MPPDSDDLLSSRQPDADPDHDGLELGLSHHRAGRLSEAETIYRQILDDNPAHPHALHYLGLICLQKGHPERATVLIDQAIRLCPGQAVFVSNRGVVTAALGQRDEAAVFYREALALAPDYADAHNNLGNVLDEQQQFEAALRHYRRALELNPEFGDALFNQARLLERMGLVSEAIACYRRAFERTPADAGVAMRLGNLLKQTCQHAEAAACFERAVVLAPDDINARFNLAYTYDAQNRFVEARAMYESALALRSDAHVHTNLAFTLMSLSLYDEAEEHYREAIRLKPTLSEAHHQLGMLRLRQGDFHEGWRLYEHRTMTTTGPHHYLPLAFPEWRGEPLQGKRILLAREQGVGDQIQFIRYAAVLQQMGAIVDAWVHEELVDLCRGATGVTCVLGEPPTQGYDYWCRLMSVPSRLPAEAPIPAGAPYLFPDPLKRDEWRTRLRGRSGSRRKIGLVWSGNPQHRLDAFRSLSLSTLAPLAELPGLAWYAIQKGATQAQLSGLAHRWPVQALGDALLDYSDTAALMDSLDLVITVDTSVAHLAGALGKPVWVLLAANSDWRWMRERSDSPWYPSARLFRQTILGEWGDVVDALKSALEL